nr:calponin-3-like [Salvelinus alpinus]
MTQFNKGPVYGLTAELRSKIAGKYDLQKEEELRFWIEEVTGMPIGENFQKGLKDGVILCELINKLQPGSIKKINHSKLNWHKLENLGNFIRAILKFGLCPNDIFEANDLFENGNMTQVQSTLLSLAGVAKTKGSNSNCDLGVKYADKRTRHFDEEKMKAGQCVIGLQVSHANTIAITTVSRSLYGGREEGSIPAEGGGARFWIGGDGMPIGENFQKALRTESSSAKLINKLQPGSIKKINHSKLNWHKANDLFENGNMTQVQSDTAVPGCVAKTKGSNSNCVTSVVKYADKGRAHFDEEKMKAGQCVIGLQAGMSAPGTRRDIYDQKSAGQTADSSTISLQMGTNKVASQKGMSSYGLGRQIYDPKYCTSPTEPTSPVTLGNNAGSHGNGSLGTGTNGSEISDSDYQAEYQYHHDDEEEYRGGYQQQYSGHYDEDQGIDY